MPKAGLYLYCMVQGSHLGPVEIKGLDEGKVFTVPTDTLTALVQQCPDEFSVDNQELASQWVLNHQAVVNFSWEHYGTVIPFSFGTVVVAKAGLSAKENLLAWIGGETKSLQATLKRLSGLAEYGIQISWDPAVVAPRLTQHNKEIRGLEQEMQSQGPGTAYLIQQKLERLLKESLERAADAYFKEFYQKIKCRTEEIRIDKVKRENSGRQMLMNLSCLAPKVDSSELGATLDKIANIAGFFVRFTGPWPPYSFASLK